MRRRKLQHPQGPIEEGPVDDGELPRSDLPKGLRVRKPLGVSRKCPKQGLQVIEEEESAGRSARRALEVLFSVSQFSVLEAVSPGRNGALRDPALAGHYARALPNKQRGDRLGLRLRRVGRRVPHIRLINLSREARWCTRTTSENLR